MRDLPWLVPAPDDFSAQCRALAAPEGDVGAQLQRLAAFRLSSPQAMAFSRLLRKVQARDLSPLAPLKLAIVSNATMEFVADHLPAAAARHGVALEIVQSEFDVVVQEAMNPDAPVNASRPDAVLMAIDHRWLGLTADGGEAGQVEAAVAKLLDAARMFKTLSGGAPILPLLATPAQRLFGSFERRAPGSLASKIMVVNQAILDFTASEGGYVLDLEAIASSVGLAEWFDPVAWNVQKQPFNPVFNALYADRLGALLGAIRGKARKCLVLDLDNTLWGGAIGDEGLSGIVLGQGSGSGEAFVNIQRAAKALKARGVILAVCSKNNDDVARSAFRDHSEMILRETDIAIFQANWVDKASNLESIADALSIGLEALVLLDDNPAERAQTRSALPMVAVPELPRDAAYFPQVLMAAGYFEAVSFNDDDALRAASYAENAQRAEVMAKSRDLGDYLTSLEMTLSCGPVNASNMARVTQLINKSNQFNLLTRRLTESEVQALLNDPNVVTLQARLMDRYGDMGLISVVTCAVDQAEATVTDWLMSCRVLGRKVEDGIYDVLMRALAGRGVRKLHARYAPTKKNNMVREHFDKLGLVRVEEKQDGARLYEAIVADYVSPSLPMAVERVFEPGLGPARSDELIALPNSASPRLPREG